MRWDDLALQVIIGLATIIVILLGLALQRLWEEVRRLRGVRHDDRDKIAELTSLVQGLKYEIEDLRRELRSWVRKWIALTKRNNDD